MINLIVLKHYISVTLLVPNLFGFQVQWYFISVLVMVKTQGNLMQRCNAYFRWTQQLHIEFGN